MKLYVCAMAWCRVFGRRAGGIGAVGLLLLFGMTPRVFAQSVEWVRQLGTTEVDDSTGVSADRLGNVYITGSTRGSLGGPSEGNFDAFLSKYDGAGNLQWTRQLGTSELDGGQAISADTLGNVFVTGFTRGGLGGSAAGNSDAFLSKYDAAGSLQWSRQLGTSSFEDGRGVSADGLGNVYVSGETSGSLDGGPNAGAQDAFLAKYDEDGDHLWTRQLGTGDSDIGHAVASDGLGNVYLAGCTFGSLAAPFAGGYCDAFVAKYDDAGNHQWTRQLGTIDRDESNGVSADGLGNVYISGRTDGSLDGMNAGGPDAFLTKYDQDGKLLWTRQMGTSGWDDSPGVAADVLGNIYVSGRTQGSLGGPSAGDSDVFVIKYDSSGHRLWSRQFGTSAFELGNAISVDQRGSIYLSGATTGNFGVLNPNPGRNDAFVLKLRLELPGDYNGNGRVEQEDLDLVLLNWGVDANLLPPTWINERPTDGVVDQMELDGVLLNWGGAAANGAARVPEPATLPLVLLMLTGIFMRSANLGRLMRWLRSSRAKNVLADHSTPAASPTRTCAVSLSDLVTRASRRVRLEVNQTVTNFCSSSTVRHQVRAEPLTLQVQSLSSS